MSKARADRAKMRPKGLVLGLGAFEKTGFAAGAARVLSDLNAIHACRDGNGRAQLAFITLLAAQAGHPSDLERLEPAAFLGAMIASFHGDESPLQAQLAALIS